MAKGRHDQTTHETSKTTLIVMVLGGLAVAALVVWALTRTVEPAVPPAATPVAETQVSVGGVEQPAGTATLAPPSTAAEARPHIEGDRSAVKRIAVEDLRSQMNRKAVTVIDVRDETSFEASHIPGALHIPLARIEGEVQYLPKDKPIVTYCT